MDASLISADIPLPPGTLLSSGKYRVEHLLGQGAFGQVYLVTHKSLGVLRALKLLRKDSPNLGSSEFMQYRERFQLEAQLGAQIQAASPHPHLVQIYDFWQEDNLLALEMEFAPGGSLSEAIRQARDQRQPIPLEQALRWTQEAALGLAALHQRDLVHRDVKPSNILLDAEGHAKLADLGLVQTPYSRLSRSDGLLPNHPGTMEYMPPEQIPPNTAPLRPPADVYALGCVLFELLTGRIYYQQQEGTRVRSIRPEIPQAVDDLVVRMLSSSPKERPWNGEEIARLLAELQTDRQTPPKPWPGRSWLTWKRAGIGLVVILLAVLLFAFVLNPPAMVAPTPLPLPAPEVGSGVGGPTQASAATDRPLAQATLPPASPSAVPANTQAPTLSVVIPTPLPGMLWWTGIDSRPGVLQSPMGVDVDAVGNVVVADTGNRRVQIFDANGKFIRMVEGFKLPVRARSDQNQNLYVLDGYNQIIKVTADGNRSTIWTGDYAKDLRVGENNQLAVILRSQKIIWMNLEGQNLQTVPFAAQNIVASGIGPKNHIYTVGYDKTLRELDENGKELRIIVSSEKGPFYSAQSLAITGDGWIYYVDKGNHVYLVIDPSGNIVYNNQSNSWMPFNNPQYNPEDISVDSKGNLYTAHSIYNVVRKFDRQGKLLAEFGVKAQNAGNLLRPLCVAYSKDRIAVCDSFNEKILLYTRDGKLSQSIPYGNLSEHIYPVDITYSQDGRMFVLSRSQGPYLVVELSPEGKPLGQFTVNITNIADMAIGPDNVFYFLDNEKAVAARYSISGNALDSFQIGEAKPGYNVVGSLAFSPDKTLWVSKEAKIWHFSLEGKLLNSFPLDSLDVYLRQSNKIWISTEGKIYVDFSNGIARINESGQAVKWVEFSDKINTILNWTGTNISGDDQGRLYIASMDIGVYAISAP